LILNDLEMDVLNLTAVMLVLARIAYFPQASYKNSATNYCYP